MVEDDLDEERLIGINENKKKEKDKWDEGLKKIERYREEWMRKDEESEDIEYEENMDEGILREKDLRVIDIKGDVEMERKKLDGKIERKEGKKDSINWKKIYLWRRDGNLWKIKGLGGYMEYRWKREVRMVLKWSWNEGKRNFC